MKARLITALSFLIAFTQPSFSQSKDYHISSVTVSSGRGALSSGIFGEVQAANDLNTLIFEVTSDYVQAMYGYTTGSFFLAGSAGYFQNAPWIGPFVVAKPTDFLTLTGWAGVSGGQAKDPQFKVMYSFTYGSAKLDLGPVYVSYAFLSFQKDKPNHLPGAGVNLPLDGKINCSVGGDYSLRDKQPLFSSSLSYSF